MLFSNYINDFRPTTPEDLKTKPRICLFCNNLMYLTYNVGYVLSCECGITLYFSGYDLYSLGFECSDYKLSLGRYSSTILTHFNKFMTESCFVDSVITDTEQLFDLDYFDLSIFYRNYLNKDLL